MRTDVRLVPLAEAHAPAMVRWVSTPEVAKNIGLRSEPTLERTREWIARAESDAATRAFAILVGERHVGNVVLDRIDPYLQTARLSVYVGEPDARHGGVGRAAVRLALETGFGALGLHKIWLVVHEENAAARKTYAALGFVVEGTLRDEFILDGRRVDAILMGILRTELAPR